MLALTVFLNFTRPCFVSSTAAKPPFHAISHLWNVQYDFMHCCCHRIGAMFSNPLSSAARWLQLWIFLFLHGPFTQKSLLHFHTLNMSAPSNNEYYSTLELVVSDRDANAPELHLANSSFKVSWWYFFRLAVLFCFAFLFAQRGHHGWIQILTGCCQILVRPTPDYSCDRSHSTGERGCCNEERGYCTGERSC